MRRGFTLIELLLVIGIIAILASIVIVAVNPSYQLAKAHNARRQSDVRAILEAFSQYSINHTGDFQVNSPAPAADCSIPLAPAPPRRLCQPSVTSVTCDFGSPNDGEGCVTVAHLVPVYLATLPTDPQDVIGGNDDLQTDYAVQLTDLGRRLNISALNTVAPPAEGQIRIAR